MHKYALHINNYIVLCLGTKGGFIMSAVKDVVQPDDWYQPREQFNSLTRVPSVSDWFCIYKLPHNIYAICEPYHFQEVMSFLVLGSERNLLIDTGMGMFDIKKEIE